MTVLVLCTFLQHVCLCVSVCVCAGVRVCALSHVCVDKPRGALECQQAGGWVGGGGGRGAEGGPAALSQRGCTVALRPGGTTVPLWIETLCDDDDTGPAEHRSTATYVHGRSST